MGQILVRNLDDDIIETLKARALERGTSLEQVARDALAQVARQTDREAWVAEMDLLRSQSNPDPARDSVRIIRAARDALSHRLDPEKLMSPEEFERPRG
jgi:plasmid stability protein